MYVENFGGDVAFLTSVGDESAFDSGGGFVFVGGQDFGLNLIGCSIDGDMLPGGAVEVGTLMASVETKSVVINLLDFGDRAKMGAGLPVVLLNEAFSNGGEVVRHGVLEE